MSMQAKPWEPIEGMAKRRQVAAYVVRRWAAEGLVGLRMAKKTYKNYRIEVQELERLPEVSPLPLVVLHDGCAYVPASRFGRRHGLPTHRIINWANANVLQYISVFHEDKRHYYIWELALVPRIMSSISKQRTENARVRDKITGPAHKGQVTL